METDKSPSCLQNPEAMAALSALRPGAQQRPRSGPAAAVTLTFTVTDEARRAGQWATRLLKSDPVPPQD